MYVMVLLAPGNDLNQHGRQIDALGSERVQHFGLVAGMRCFGNDPGAFEQEGRRIRVKQVMVY